MKQNFNFKEAPDPTAVVSQEHRCHCGQLLARLVPEGVELKCKRCKQISVVALEAARS